MKPIRETVAPSLTATELVVCEALSGADFGCVWHQHPECEITLVLQGGSDRWVGDKVERLLPGDLVFLGGGLPHDYRADRRRRSRKDVKAVVVQFLPDVLGGRWQACTSMSYMLQLFRRSGRGLQVLGTTRDRAEEILLRMVEAHGVRRQILLLELLELFASSAELKEIASDGFRLETSERSADRIGAVLSHIEEHFKEQISVHKYARMAGLSDSAFTRLFKRCTCSTLPNFVHQFRIARACRLLAETDLTSEQISAECGYGSPSHFQRQFARHAHCSPRAYRNKVRGPTRQPSI
jgi:AraC-like DNA-binding protein